jgi:hypothetical protein
MHFQDIFAHDGVYDKDRKRLFLITSLSLLLILGVGIICYDNDLSDNNDPPVIALQCPIIYPDKNEITLIKLISASINLPLINKTSLLTRAPPR